MPETAANLVDYVIPPLPLRQWGLSVSQRLRWYLEREALTVAAIWQVDTGDAVTKQVNDLANQLKQAGFFATVRAMLGELDLSSRVRDLEVTECALLEDARCAELLLIGLRARGFCTALDD